MHEGALIRSRRLPRSKLLVIHTIINMGPLPQLSVNM